MAAKKKNRKSALKDSEPLVPIAFDSIPLGLDGEETSSVAPAAKGWRDICSSEEHEDMVKVSLSAKFDEELPEVGKPDTDHDLEAMEGGKAAADNISSRSSDAFDIGKTPSWVCLANECANILRYSSSFAKREHLGKSGHIGRR